MVVNTKRAMPGLLKIMIAVILNITLILSMGNVVKAQGLPEAPSGITAVMVNANRVELNWTDNSNNESGFYLYTAINSLFTQGLMIITLTANSTSFSDLSVYPGDTFYYRLTAFNAEGESSFSNTVSVYIPLAEAGIPAAPSNLVAHNSYADKVELSWRDNSGDEIGFLLERSLNAEFAVIEESFNVPANTINFLDETVKGFPIYYYRVTAYNAVGSSQASNVAIVSIAISAIVPEAPSDLTANAVSTTQIDLAWRDNSSDEDGFILERARDAGFTDSLQSFNLSAGTEFYQDTSLEADTAYYYRVTAFNAKGKSPSSNIASDATFEPDFLAPGNLKAQAEESDIVLYWEDNSDDETGFRIERAVDNRFTQGFFSKATGPDVTLYKDLNLPAGTYFYRVAAIYGSGVSEYSNVVSVMIDDSDDEGIGGSDDNPGFGNTGIPVNSPIEINQTDNPEPSAASLTPGTSLNTDSLSESEQPAGETAAETVTPPASEKNNSQVQLTPGNTLETENMPASSAPVARTPDVQSPVQTLSWGMIVTIVVVFGLGTATTGIIIYRFRRANK
jgi:fibronectin type 3 domain-containing protein